MKKLTVTIIISIVVGVAAVAFTLFKITSWAEGSSYYTQIANHSVEINESGRDGVIDFKGGMPYIYSLPAFSEKGEKQLISFGATRELKDCAFIHMTVVPIRGVIRWEEVYIEDMPESVREMF